MNKGKTLPSALEASLNRYIAEESAMGSSYAKLTVVLNVLVRPVRRTTQTMDVSHIVENMFKIFRHFSATFKVIGLH